MNLHALASNALRTGKAPTGLPGLPSVLRLTRMAHARKNALKQVEVSRNGPNT